MSQQEVEAFVFGTFRGAGEDLIKRMALPPFDEIVRYIGITFGEYDFFLLVKASGKTIRDAISNSLIRIPEVERVITLFTFEVVMEPFENILWEKDIAIVLCTARAAQLGWILNKLKALGGDERVIRVSDVLGSYDFVVFMDATGGLAEVGNSIIHNIRIEGVERTKTLLAYATGR